MKQNVQKPVNQFNIFSSRINCDFAYQLTHTLIYNLQSLWHQSDMNKCSKLIHSWMMLTAMSSTTQTELKILWMWRLEYCILRQDCHMHAHTCKQAPSPLPPTSQNWGQKRWSVSILVILFFFFFSFWILLFVCYICRLWSYRLFDSFCFVRKKPL